MLLLDAAELGLVYRSVVGDDTGADCSYSEAADGADASLHSNWSVAMVGLRVETVLVQVFVLEMESHPFSVPISV